MVHLEAERGEVEARSKSGDAARTPWEGSVRRESESGWLQWRRAVGRRSGESPLGSDAVVSARSQNRAHRGHQMPVYRRLPWVSTIHTAIAFHTTDNSVAALLLDILALG